MRVPFNLLTFPLLFLLVVMMMPAKGGAETDTLKPGYGEYEIKAAFIYNFPRFVEWPNGGDNNENERDAPAICILGEDPFEGAMESIQGRLIEGRKMTVSRVRSIKKAADCPILFISSSEKERIGEIIKAIGGSGILTIGDTEGFSRQGVIINFYTEQNKVRFEINIAAARRAGITLSSKLLKLARITYK